MAGTSPAMTREGETRYRRKQRGAEGVQAIPGVEQASPCGVRLQTTQLSVHSRHVASGAPFGMAARGSVLRPKRIANVATSKATATERVTARASSHDSMGQP
ncbi:hypothetical protein IC232_01345 [Microvirga sp. BT688]|uniref:hypothetical protein n=1 Tax=Microvirga sp. TaxID=1873136 RepID=UPI001684882F|nr:hypothetical protein [Microvirga sp.]MBD2745327.1 hypothetical protein [Microvirga sp.]